MANFNPELMFDLAVSINEAKRGIRSPEGVFPIPAGTMVNGVDVGGKSAKIGVAAQERVLRSCVQAFMQGVVVDHPVRQGMKLQAFSGSGDLPKLVADQFTVNMAVPNFDLNYQDVFKGVPLKRGQLYWEIAGVSTGLAFKKIPEGGKTEYASTSGDKTLVDIFKYGAGLGVTWETIEGRKLYLFIDQLTDARSKLYKLWADVHYGALATAGAGNAITWQTAIDDVNLTTVLDKDIATINAAAFALADRNKNKGYGDTANMLFKMYASPKLRNRLNNAMRVTVRDVAPGGNKQAITVDYMVDVSYSFNGAIADNTALLVLPGNKIQNSMYLQEAGYSREEIESLNELRTYWTAFGVGIGDTDQVFLVNFA